MAKMGSKETYFRYLSALLFSTVTALPIGLYLLGIPLYIINLRFKNRDLIWFLSSIMIKVFALLLDCVSNVTLTLHSNFDVLKEKSSMQAEKYALIICNHQCSSDWLILDIMAQKIGMLGRMRHIMKEEMKLIPIYGHAAYGSKGIFIKRGKENCSANKLRKGVEYLMDSQLKSWISLFPEGTIYDNNYPYIIDKSRDYCKSKGYDELTMSLMPRVTGFKTIMDTIGNKLDAIYDLTMVYSSTRVGCQRVSPPSLIDLFSGHSKNVDIYMERIDPKLVPSHSVKLLERWIYGRFMKKEEALKKYYHQNMEFSSAFDGKYSFDCNKNELVQRLLAFIFVICLDLPLLVFNPIGPLLYVIVTLILCIGGHIHLKYYS